MHSALVNSVMIRPHPPRPRIMRRKTVSVTPAMGARTVPGEINLSRIEKGAGNILFRVISRQDSEFAILQRVWRARQRRQAGEREIPGPPLPEWKDAPRELPASRQKILPRFSAPLSSEPLRRSAW